MLPSSHHHSRLSLRRLLPSFPNQLSHSHTRPLRRNHSRIHSVALPVANSKEDEELSPVSAAAVAAAIRRASPASPVEFTRCRPDEEARKGGSLMPSSDFQRLCVEQLQLFRMVVTSDAILSVYVRPAGSYIMDQLELHRVVFFPGVDVSDSSDCVALVCNFSVVAGLRGAEAALSKQELDFIPEYGAMVFPLVKHPFIVGFLVAEIPNLEPETCVSSESTQVDVPNLSQNHSSYEEPLGIQPYKEDLVKSCHITLEERSRAVMISQSLATAYVMDQKAMLLQQTSWQNNVRMGQLVEQIRGPLSSIRALAKMLTAYVKKSQIPYDIVEDILVQGNHMRDALQQIQDAVYLTKANIVRHNEDTMKRMNGQKANVSLNPLTPFLPYYNSEDEETENIIKFDSLVPSLSSEKQDIEIPMPPLWLAPLQEHDTRPCNVSEILKDLVGAAVVLAYKQNRSVELSGTSASLQVAVEESALRQALSNLIEGALLRTQIGGQVQIYSGGAPAGGALVLIDDDGPDMQYLTQMHSLTPFGTDLLAEGMLEDNMAWNFIAGLTVAREILESFGCVVRVISPRKLDSAFGTGGTRIELWLPSVQSNSLREGAHDA
ncbi:chloroplast sensor kinase [Rhynchospora pubera]|uniref:Chloroplast sensor kinase n=1 Tax=Rhynchospora pubera TaxID=906938 RepID=A0AAV8FPD9_9POAL|nr:chloroplast sensor kinase [Rhynchospora pubera]